MDIETIAPLRRCAIYTRKSTNQRLEHDVNSLVTQREISSAYITSQQYKGWVELPNRYDDGGHSGSGMDRPALAQLMQDIEAGEVDVVVVYKIDRLTRSLADFVRMIEIFDRRNIALVSISQAFDTSDSMGRMILNVLLTFSQFERELIAERVRDSIRTRKRHGKMHGGLPPFGYIATPDGLKIDEPEAEIVRFIFEEFLRTRRYTKVMTAVRERGYCSSVKYSPRGKPRGGTAISPSTVYSIVQNPMYVGEIRGHDTTYPGEHTPLISRDIWNEAQIICQERKKRKPNNRDTDHFLAGLLWDDLGRHMRLDLKWHWGKFYKTYVSSNAIWSQKLFLRQYRASADQLDEVVLAAVAIWREEEEPIFWGTCYSEEDCDSVLQTLASVTMRQASQECALMFPQPPPAFVPPPGYRPDSSIIPPPPAPLPGAEQLRPAAPSPPPAPKPQEAEKLCKEFVDEI